MGKYVPLVAVLLALMTSPLMAVGPTVSIPDDIVGTVGGVVVAPISLNDATDLEAFDFEVFYDTDLLDLNSADVRRGTLTAGWGGTLVADDTIGKAWGNVYGGPLTAGSGSVIELHFQVISPGTSPLTLSETYLNEEIVPGLDHGSITTVPEPATFVGLATALLLAMSVRRIKRR